MAQFDENSYYQILTQVIQPQKNIPFDCYLLLEQNKTIVLVVKSGSPFDVERFGKVFSYENSKIYVKNEDKIKYFAYLNSFLLTPAGRLTFKLLKETNRFQIGFPQEQDTFPLSNLEKLNKMSDEELTSPEAQGSTYSLVIGHLLKEVDHLKRMSLGNTSLSQDEKTKIEFIIHKIQNEFLIHKVFPETTKDKLAFKKSVSEIIQEIDLFSQTFKNNKEEKDLLDTMIELKAQITPLLELKGQDAFDKEKKNFSVRIKNVGDLLKRVHSQLKFGEVGIISASLSRIINQTQKTLGEKLLIQVEENLSTQDSIKRDPSSEKLSPESLNKLSELKKYFDEQKSLFGKYEKLWSQFEIKASQNDEDLDDLNLDDLELDDLDEYDEDPDVTNSSIDKINTDSSSKEIDKTNETTKESE